MYMKRLNLNTLLLLVAMLIAGCGGGGGSTTPIANQAPTANAGADKTVLVNDVVAITGIGTDTDGTVISYQWKEGSTVLADTASFDFNQSTTGTYTLTLTVTDDDNATATDTMNVNVVTTV